MGQRKRLNYLKLTIPDSNIIMQTRIDSVETMELLAKHCEFAAKNLRKEIEEINSGKRPNPFKD